MEKQIVAILLLDTTSRKQLKTNISEIGLQGVLIVNNFNEITEDIVSKCNKVVVLEGYLDSLNSFSDIRLFSALLNIKLTFIGTNPDKLKILSQYGNVFNSDPTKIDFETIQGALYQDSVLEQHSDINKLSDSIKASQSIIANESYDTTVQEVAKDFINISTELVKTQDDLTYLEYVCKNLQNINAKLSTENATLTDGFSKMLANAVTLNKSLKEYERIMSKDIYAKININNYPNKPAIIYLKEVEELIHENSFIETLFEILRLQGKQSVKVVRLYDGSSCRRMKALPSYYYPIRNQFLVSDLVSNDFIVKVGDYHEIFDILFTNKMHLDVLIIVDCKTMDDTVTNGATVYLNLCRNRNNIEAYDINVENTIVNGEEEEGYNVWEHYEHYKDLISKEEKYLFLSSRPVMQSILDLYRLMSTSI